MARTYTVPRASRSPRRSRQRAAVVAAWVGPGGGVKEEEEERRGRRLATAGLTLVAKDAMYVIGSCDRSLPIFAVVKIPPETRSVASGLLSRPLTREISRRRRIRTSGANVDALPLLLLLLLVPPSLRPSVPRSQRPNVPLPVMLWGPVLFRASDRLRALLKGRPPGCDLLPRGPRRWQESC
jgi:hypothetical protein